MINRMTKRTADEALGGGDVSVGGDDCHKNKELKSSAGAVGCEYEHNKGARVPPPSSSSNSVSVRTKSLHRSVTDLSGSDDSASATRT